MSSEGEGPALEACRFTGDAREYFRIWIVNLFLSLATLGIYSAWAKVRKKRYFYGNTWIAGANFEYHGDPLAILKGRVLAFAAFITYSFASNFSPRVAAIVLLVLMPVIPWLVLRSFAFNARNSSYRHLRFHFSGSYRKVLLAIAPFFVLPLMALAAPPFNPLDPAQEWTAWLPVIASPLLLAIFYPWMAGSLRLILANGTTYGTAGFRCAARIRSFYFLYFIAALLAVAASVAFGFLVALLFAGAPSLAPVAGGIFYVVVVALIFGFTQSRIANLVFNATVIGETTRMKSKLRARKLAGIYMGNLLAIVLTAGLAIPWAAVRTARYRAGNLWIESADLEGFLGGVSVDVAATGEELADFFDLDISL